MVYTLLNIFTSLGLNTGEFLGISSRREPVWATQNVTGRHTIMSETILHLPRRPMTVVFHEPTSSTNATARFLVELLRRSAKTIKAK